MMKSLWITWESQPRNKSMARVVGADYLEVSSKKRRVFRYLECISESTKAVKIKPEVLFVQNPSIVLCAWAVTVGKFFSKKVVIDAHNSGVYPLEGRVWLVQQANRVILRGASLVIVSNEELARVVKEDFGCRNAIAIPDPLPNLIEVEKVENKSDRKKVFVICSWSEDEPIELYINVARALPGHDFLFSGNSKKYKGGLVDIPSNIQLLGYVSSNEYTSLLFNSDLILDLTTREFCLVCGAYEAVAASTPVVLTDNELNREVFGSGAVYSELNLTSLTNVITTVISKQQHYINESKLHRVKMLRAEESIAFQIMNNI